MYFSDSLSGEVLIDQEALRQQDPTKISKIKNSTGLQLPGSMLPLFLSYTKMA